jgi:hypothetical protein
MSTSKTKLSDEAQQQQILQQRINELRVSYQELTIRSRNITPEAVLQRSLPDSSFIGDSTNKNDVNNKVYIQLSSRSVAILTDRTIAEARVSRQLQKACDELESLQ